MRNDLIDVEFLAEPATASWNAVTDHGRNYLALAIALRPEVVRCCILIGVSTSIANGLAARQRGVTLSALIGSFPADSAKLMLASHRIRRLYGGSALCRAMTKFNDCVADAKSATIGSVALDALEGAGRTDRFSELANKWRLASHAGAELLAKIDQDLSGQGLPGASEELEPLFALLSDAIGGATAKLDANGRVVFPEWADRREFGRTSVRSAARLLSRKAGWDVTIRDVSLTGIGIDCPGCDLPVGEEVILQIGDASDVVGSVIWSKDGRLGIQLLRPIQSDWPLLEFLSKLP